MDFFAWVSLFFICLLGAMSPGPSLAVVIKNTLANGKISGLLTSWAHAFGIGVYALLTMLGLAVILEQNPTLYRFISYGGALYLAWLGWNALRSRGGIANKIEKGETKAHLASMRDGILISILNPKIALFFIALFSQFITPDVGISGQIITVLTPFLTDGVWYSVVVLALLTPKILEKLRQNAAIIDKIIGVMLILLALKILLGEVL